MGITTLWWWWWWWGRRRKGRRLRWIFLNIFSAAIKYRMNDGATFEGRNIGVTWWTRNLLLGRARPITRGTSPFKNLCLFSLVRYWKGEPRITGCLDVGYGTLLLRFSAQGALVVGVVLFDSWLSLRALVSVSYG